MPGAHIKILIRGKMNWKSPSAELNHASNQYKRIAEQKNLNTFERPHFEVKYFLASFILASGFLDLDEDENSTLSGRRYCALASV